jgi:ferredoxin
MCQFCVTHGDGRRWYLNAANYSADLLADARRREYIRDFIPTVTTRARRWLRILDRARRLAPGPTARLARGRSAAMERIHFGQVIPLEDVAAVLDIAGQVVRLPCVCRQVLAGRQEAVCYLLAATPGGAGLPEMLTASPEAIPFAGSLEKVEPRAALAEMARLEERGLIHTVWTFITPFVGAICNCDAAGCLAMNFTARGFRLYLPGEWRARVGEGDCTGCGGCRERCPFGAITLQGGGAAVDPGRCHGCGICRPACGTGAITLHLREQAA